LEEAQKKPMLAKKVSNPDTTSGASAHTAESSPPEAAAEQSRRPVEELLAELKEQIQRCLGLEPTELFVTEESADDCGATRRLGELYTGNLIPSEAFLQLYQWKLKQQKEEASTQHELEFRRLIRAGGMIEPWIRTLREQTFHALTRADKQPSIRDATFLCLQNADPGCGRYRAMGLQTPEGTLAASLTFREPPPAPSAMVREQYRTFIATHLKHQCEVQPAQYPSMMEIDTINVLPNYHGAGSALIAWTLASIAAEDTQPQDIFYYRFARIGIIYPHIPGHRRPTPANTVSSALFTDCGFDDLSDQLGKGIVREIDGVPDRLSLLLPTWRYGMARFDVAQSLSLERWQRIAKKTC
jgi:hypothetical protein